MRAVVGLGNPGKEYEHSRHNMGFMAVDRLATRLGVMGWKTQFSAQILKGKISGEDYVLCKPTTYMNLSGQSVQPMLAYFKIDPADCLVIVDDLELPPGKIRTRDRGSHGGHNGLRSIIALLGTDEFKRVRVGIGRPAGNSVTGHVLGKLSQDESIVLDTALDQAVDLAYAYLEKGQFENWSSP